LFERGESNGRHVGKTKSLRPVEVRRQDRQNAKVLRERESRTQSGEPPGLTRPRAGRPGGLAVRGDVRPRVLAQRGQTLASRASREKRRASQGEGSQ
jgi:hypothetical protein